MRLVSRYYIALNRQEVLYQMKLAGKHISDKTSEKRLNYFKTLYQKMANAGMNSIDRINESVHINVSNPSFRELEFDVLKMEIPKETILNAFVVACYRKNYTMAERIKRYLTVIIEHFYPVLAGEIEEDVRGYILDNGISIDEFLTSMDLKKIYNESSGIINGTIFDKTRFDSTKRFMGEIILNAYTTAIRKGNVEMAKQIRPYVMKGFLDKQIDEDVMEYILCNGVSSEEYLENPKAGLDESGNKVY